MNAPRTRAQDPTLPELLLEHGRVRPARPAYRHKDLGLWQTSSWAEVNRQVRMLACGLAALGFRRGMNLAIIGENRPRLYWSMAAAQCLGGVPVPLYQDAPADDMAYVLENAEIDYVIAEDQEQVDKLLDIRARFPALDHRLRHIVYDEDRGMRLYSVPGLASYESVQELGREFDRAQPAYFDAEIAAGSSDDCAIMLYTSGTTGRPKGVRLSHRAMIDRARVGATLDRLNDRDSVVSYLPMAWAGDNLFSYAQAFVTGFTVNCPESAETVMTDLREIGPTYYFAPPRVFENLLTTVTIRMEDAGFLKRMLFERFMKLARRVGVAILDGAPVRWWDRLAYAVGNVCVYAPLRDVLGLSAVRVGYTAGEAISPELFTFYRAIGINLKQLYGSTETFVFVCIQPDGQVRSDTVGPPAEGVQIRIGANGEVLLKSPGLFQEYYKHPDQTAEVYDADGWYRTGDAGFIDDTGHLKIIDRARDVGRLDCGALFAPKYIENKLKFSPYIKEAVAFGNARECCAAMINIDMQAVGNWAERRGLAYSGYADLAAQPAVYDLIAGCVDQVNAELARDITLCSSQIHRFLILHKELDPDDDELTRTRKVRRAFVAHKYQALIDALYSGRPSQYIETEVKFEDGRRGVIAADIAIRPARTHAALRAAA